MFLRQDAFAAQILQSPLQFVGKRLEHTLDDDSGLRGNKHDKGRSEGCQGMACWGRDLRSRPMLDKLWLVKRKLKLVGHHLFQTFNQHGAMNPLAADKANITS